ncbi:MAG: DUF523 domain-containing protein [Bacillota bacterium]
MLLASACLLGLGCRYDGRSKPLPQLVELLKLGQVMPVCPEQLGGLSTPRARSEIVGGTGEDVLEGKARVLTETGTDVTCQFIRGAMECLYLARQVNPELIVLCDGSPSCGSTRIADGTFSGRKVAGKGVCAALLCKHGFQVCPSERFGR